jgi:hypothetical protein
MSVVPDPVNGMAEQVLQTVDELERRCSQLRGHVAQLLMIAAAQRERPERAKEAA